MVKGRFGATRYHEACGGNETQSQRHRRRTRPGVGLGRGHRTLSQANRAKFSLTKQSIAFPNPEKKFFLKQCRKTLDQNKHGTD